MCFAVLSWCIVSFGLVVCLVGMGCCVGRCALGWLWWFTLGVGSLV